MFYHMQYCAPLVIDLLPLYKKSCIAHRMEWYLLLQKLSNHLVDID